MSVWVNCAGEFLLGVSRCCATHFLLLVQKKVSKGKGHPVLRRRFAPMPCAAAAERGQPETRRAARDSDIRLSFSLSASTARRCAQGDRIQTKTGSLTLRQDREAIFVGQRRRQVRPERSEIPTPYAEANLRPGARLAVPVFGPRVARREAQGRRVSGALRRCGQLSERRQSDASSGRKSFGPSIAVHRRASRRRATRVSFSFAYFLLDKQKKVSRTAVRNQRNDELVSAGEFVARKPLLLDQRPSPVALKDEKARPVSYSNRTRRGTALD